MANAAQNDNPDNMRVKYSSLNYDIWVDLKGLQVDGEEKLLEKLRDLSLNILPQQVTKIQGAIQGSNPLGLYREAHALKSSLAQVGADAASKLSRQLEALGKSGSVDGAALLVAQLEVELKRVYSELSTIVQDVLMDPGA